MTQRTTDRQPAAHASAYHMMGDPVCHLFGFNAHAPLKQANEAPFAMYMAHHAVQPALQQFAGPLRA